MQRVPAIRDKRGSYELIGRPATMFDVKLSPDRASEFRDFIAQDFMPRVMSATPDRFTMAHGGQMVRKLDETSDKTMFRTRFGYDRLANPDAAMAYFTGCSLLHAGPEAWKFTALVTRYRDDFTENKTTIRHHISMFEGRLFDAHREVRLVLPDEHDMIRELESGNSHVASTQRVAFDRPITEHHIDSLQDHLDRVAERYIATRP